MAEKRICVMCGSAYEYCPSCNKQLPKWMFAFDEEECKNAYDTLSKYHQKYIDANEAANQLKGIDVNKFVKNKFMTSLISEIQDKTKKKEQIVSSNKSVDDAVIDAESVKPTTMYRRQSRKTNFNQ